MTAADDILRAHREAAMALTPKHVQDAYAAGVRDERNRIVTVLARMHHNYAESPLRDAVDGVVN